MEPEDFLRNLKDDLEYCHRTAENKHVLSTLKQSIKKIEAQLANPDVQPRCGLYLHDGSRQYGYTFDQLKHLLAEYQNPKSVFYQKKWELASLLKWLQEVSRTSIGDLHGDMLKHVVVTYHRPEDFADDELDEIDKVYDKFWEEIVEQFSK